MKKQFLPALFFFIVSLLSFYASEAKFDTGDSLALVDLYNSTNGPNWKKNTNWLTANPLNTWYGVGTSGTRVTSLALSFNRLKGKLPASIGNLAQLNNLALDENNLSDTIPASIGNLTLVTDLDLELNQFSGSIPATIGNLTAVTKLGLNGNHLTGTVPSSLYALTKLTLLALSNNNLSGTLSPALGNFTLLNYAFLDDNQFTGSLPNSVGNLTNLYVLNIMNNSLSGSFPSGISGCTFLYEIDAGNNQFSGSLPVSLGETPRLQQVDFTNNNLSGDVPLKLVAAPILRYLYLSHNHLTASKNYKGNGQPLSVAYLDVSSNNYNFNGLEFVASTIPAPTYGNQALLSLHMTGKKLSVNAGGTLSNNTYTWYKTGSAVPVATLQGDSAFQPVSNGQYYAAITNSVVSGLTLATDTVTYSAVSAIADKTLIVSVSPNPAKDYLVISGLSKNQSAKIIVTDMSGYVWLSAVSRNNSMKKIAIGSLKNGNYFLQVNEGGETIIKQFVKQ